MRDSDIFDEDEDEDEEMGELLTPGEVPREQWSDFLERFAINYEGWIVDVDWLGTDPDDVDEIEDRLVDDYAEYVLEGIDSDLDTGNGRIAISLSENRRIVLDGPERVELLETEGRTDERLEIEASGVTLGLHLRFPELEQSRATGPFGYSTSEESGLPGEDEDEAVEDDLTVVSELPF